MVFFFFVQTMSCRLYRKMIVYAANHCKGNKPTLKHRLPSLWQWLD